MDDLGPRLIGIWVGLSGGSFLYVISRGRPAINTWETSFNYAVALFVVWFNLRRVNG